jgi:Fur family peroxide stress response transcriptional regulator
MARRYSAQKKMIGDTLAQMDHPTAAEVYEEVRKAYPQISLGTVYRNLSLMADDGEILRLSFPDAPDRFDPNAHEHYHVACSRCGRIFDTDHTLSPELVKQIDRAVEACTGVRVENRMMIFIGVCAACQSGRA